MLHVFVRNHDDWELSVTDDIRASHYSERIYLDGEYAGAAELGTIGHPFDTVQEAASYLWHGSVLVTTPGNYSGPVTINKATRIDPTGFPVILGAP